MCPMWLHILIKHLHLSCTWFGVVPILDTKERKKERKKTSGVAMNEGHFTLIIVASSYVTRTKGTAYTCCL
jgi:hypothetical protein